MALVANAICLGVWEGISGQRSANDVGVLVAGVVGLWAGFVGVPVLVSRRKGAGQLAVDFGLRFARADLGLGVAAGLAGQAMVVGVVAVLHALIGKNTPTQQALDTVKHAHGVGLGLVVVVVVVGVPIAEELFFRGLLLRSLARRVGRPAAIVGSALVFGLAHLEGNRPGAVEVTVITALVGFGVMQALLAETTHRLGPGIVAHATFNALTLALAGAVVGR